MTAISAPQLAGPPNGDPVLRSFLAADGGRVSPLVFGCEQLGGHGWGDVDVAAIESAVRRAVDAGVCVFDTADAYGLGESEMRLGRAIAGRRSEVFVATKFGVRFDDQRRRFNDGSADWCRRAIGESLRRLGTDYIDLYQLHCADGRTPLGETVEALERLRVAGSIRAYGVCNLSSESLRTESSGRCATYSCEYSLLNREFEDDAKHVLAQGKYFLPYGVLGQGLLTGKYRESSQFPKDDRRRSERYVNFHGDRLARSIRIVDVLSECAAEMGRSPAQLAIAWSRELGAGTLPLVGIKSTRQLEDAIEGVRMELPPSVRARLDAASTHVG